MLSAFMSPHRSLNIACIRGPWRLITVPGVRSSESVAPVRYDFRGYSLPGSYHSWKFVFEDRRKDFIKSPSDLCIIHKRYFHPVLAGPVLKIDAIPDGFIWHDCLKQIG